jgi:hypothetical protein
MLNIRAVPLWLLLSIVPAFGQAPPPIPPLPDVNRTVTYNISGSTAQAAVPFSVFGDCSDIQVQIAGVNQPLPTSLWNCASQSGFALNTLPLPITDMVVNLTPALTSGSLTISGAWHARNLTVPTSPGINRREYEQAISTLIAGQRETFGDLQGLGFVPISAQLAAPSCIGCVTPYTGAFTTLGSTGLSTLSNAAISGTPLQVLNFSGFNVNASLVMNTTAVSTTAPEQTAIFKMTTNTGAPSLGTYKAALGWEIDAGSASSPVWGANGLAQANAGYPVLTQDFTTLELDMNNLSGTNCIDEDPGSTGHYCGPLVITGASTSQLTYGIDIGGFNQVRNGILFASGGPISADLLTYDASQTLWTVNGAHVNGIYAGGATFSTYFLVGPGGNFIVDGLGNLTANSVTSTVKGQTSGSAVAAGSIGEVKSAALATGSAVSMTTATPKDVLTLSITAGVWQCSGAIGTVVDGTTVTTAIFGSIGTTINTVSNAGTTNNPMGGSGSSAAGAAVLFSLSAGVFNVSTTTTLHMAIDPYFTTSTLSGFGNMSCVRSG